MNTTELRKNGLHWQMLNELHKAGLSIEDETTLELADRTARVARSEIEAAERRRTEDVVEMLKRIEDVYLPLRSAEDMGRTHALERAVLQISSKFLKTPEQ